MQQKFLDFIVDDQFIRAPHYTVVADSKDYLVARFTFSEQWQGLVKTAVFQDADGKAYFVVLDKDTCPIPHEVIQPTRFLVSVFGGDRLTADRAMIEVAASGFTANGVTPPAPTPDVYNQLTEAVAAERQLAQAAATTAAEKAEQCVYLTASAESLLQEAEHVDVLTSAAKEAEQQAAAHAAAAEGNAKEAETAAKAAKSSEVVANDHATASYLFSEEAKTAATEAADAAKEATLAATQLKEDAEKIERLDRESSRQLLASITVEEPTAIINIAFEKPVKDFYLIFTGALTEETDVKNCTLACMTDKGSHYFFFASALSFAAGQTAAFIAHAQQIADVYWKTEFGSSTASVNLQGTSASCSTTKTSFSKRRGNVPLYVQNLQFFEFDKKYTFTTGSTVEVWGIPAE